MIEVLVAWVGRVILIVLVMRLVTRMFIGGGRGAAPAPNASRGGRGERGGNSEKTVAKLVRDPQCGTYVAENTAIAASVGGQTLHFCSERCRDEYLASPRAAAI